MIGRWRHRGWPRRLALVLTLAAALGQLPAAHPAPAAGPDGRAQRTVALCTPAGLRTIVIDAAGEAPAGAPAAHDCLACCAVAAAPLPRAAPVAMPNDPRQIAAIPGPGHPVPAAAPTVSSARAPPVV